MLSQLQRYEEALAVFDRSIKRGPFWRAYDSKGDVLMKLGREAEAKRSYQEALDELAPKLVEQPAWADAYEAIGDILTKLGRTVEAEQAYQKADELAAQADA